MKQREIPQEETMTDEALAQWARQRLAEGASGLHAEVRERMDAVLLEVALAATDGHRGDAAARLGVGRNTVTRKLGSGRRRRGRRGTGPTGA